MARSTDLPRMQNQARTRAPLERGLNVVAQAVEKTTKSKEPPKPQMMRQYDLVERVRRYNPNTNEALLNRAYVYAMKAHGEQKRASGDPYFSHPLEVAAILTDLKLDDATIAAALLHDTIEDTAGDPRRDRPAVRPGHRRAGRGPDQAEEARPRHQGGQAGGEPAQAPAGDRRRRARAAGQARRPAAQHAHPRAHAARGAPPHRRGDARHLCAARRPHGHARDARGARGSGLPRAQSRRLQGRHRAAATHWPSATTDLIAEIEQQLTRKLADRGIAAEVTGRRKRAYSIWRKMERKSVGFEQLSDIFGFRVIVKTRRRVLPGARHRAHHLAGGARPLQGLHLDAQAERLPLDPHHRDRARASSASSCRSAPSEMHEIAEYGIAAHALYKDGAGSPTEMLSRESNAYAWLRRTIELLAEGSNPEEFLEHTKLELFHDQVFCFTPEGQADRAAARRHADRLRLCGAHRRRQHGGRLPRSTARSRRWSPSCRTATRSRSSPRRRRPRRRRPGNRSSSPARRAPPSAAPPAPRCATQYAGLGRRIVERLCQRAKIAYSDEKLQGALPRLARASIDDVLAAVGRGEMRAADVARAMYPDYKEERAAAIAQRRRLESGWFGLKRSKAVKFKVPGRRARRARRSRSAASTATCRCASRPTAARCRATASSAS